jgi:leader peptidase (prepilin peptidase)/N-methyltransferase
MILAFVVIIFGGAVGSFLALVADRLPLDEDIIRRPSQCRTCQAPVAWRDKLPILSYLLLGGQCRSCNGEIPKRLYYTEAAGVALASLAVVVAASPLHMLLGALLLWCLMGLVLCDFADFRLPDFLTLALFLIGMALAIEDPDRNVQGALIGAAVGAGSFWVIRVGYKAFRGREGLGMGDVKLMAGIGAAVGVTALPVTALIAALGALLITALKGWRGSAEVKSTTAIPFGAYLSIAAGIVWLTMALI